MQIQEGGGPLHPLLVTTRSRRWEDSVDTTMEGEGGRSGNVDEEASRIYGVPAVDTQGPAGSRVPDLDDRPRRRKFGGEEEQRWGYPESGDAPPDAVGPVPPLEAEMTEADYDAPAGDAAAAAVLAAHRQGARGSSQMLDALEAAEEAYEAQQAQQALQVQRSGLGAAAAAAGTAVRPPDTPRKKEICEATRERLIQRLFEALQANPRHNSEPSRDLMSHAQEVEDALFARAHSKQVYLSTLSNAVRLARTAQDVGDIPRIAAGEPRAVAEGHTAGEPTPYVSGLAVIKPQYL